MDLVTLTDHDSIERRGRTAPLPGFFCQRRSHLHACRAAPRPTSASMTLPSASTSKSTAAETDLIRLLAYLSEQRLFFTVNHVFSSVTGRRNAEDYEWFSGYFPAVEARNGQMLPSANQHAAEFRLEAMQDSGGRKRRARAGLRRHNVHRSSRRQEQGRVFRRPARGKRPPLRRIRRLLETDAGHFAALRRNDAQGSLDHAAVLRSWHWSLRESPWTTLSI